MRKNDITIIMIAFILMLGLLASAVIMLKTAAEQIEEKNQRIASLHALNCELADQLDEAKRQLAEAVTADAPTWEEAETETEAVDSAEVDLLARIIMCEMGSNGHPDEQLYNVGSVVLNRISDGRFPDTVRGVIYQAGQYAPAISGAIETVQPTARCYTIAKDLLSNGSRLPASVVWQSTTPQGSAVYETFYSPVTGETTYFCN